MENFKQNLLDALPSPENTNNNHHNTNLPSQIATVQPSHTVQLSPAQNLNTSNPAQNPQSGNAVSGDLQACIQGLTDRLNQATQELDTAEHDRDVAKSVLLNEEREHIITQGSLTASQQLVLGLTTQKDNAMNELVEAGKEKHGLEGEVRALKLKITQYENEARTFEDNARQTLQRAQMEFQQSQKDKLHAQQVANTLHAEKQVLDTEKQALERAHQALQTAYQELDKAYQASKQALQQQLDEKREYADKLEEVKRQEQTLRARMSQLEADLNSLTEEGSKKEAAQGPGQELLRASSLIRVCFSVKSCGFSGIYKLKASQCVRLQGMFNNVLMQARGELYAEFGEEWEVALSQTVVTCVEPRSSGRPDTVIPSLRGFDQKLAIAEAGREANVEAIIASIDWDKMCAAFPAETVARMQQSLRRKALPIETYAGPATDKFASWVRRNVKEGSAERLVIRIEARLRRKL